MTVSRAPASGAARSQAMLIAALLAVTIAALLVRCLAIAEPLGIDQSLWASAVRGMSRGQRLYHDVWEQRPPGIYWIYYAGFSVFGWTPATVAWLDIGASALTTLALFALGRALADTLTGAAAAAAYAVLTMPAWLYGHGGFLERSVCETFIAVCVALGAWCAVRMRDTGSLAAAAGLGLTAGMAVVLKPNAGLYFPALLLWLVLYRRDAMADVVRSVIAAIAASAIVPALALLWLWRLDLLHDAKVAVVEFNRFYVAEGFSPARYAVDFSKAVWLRMKTEPLWTAGAAGAMAAVWQFARSRRLPPAAGLAVIWGGAAVLVIVVNGARLFNSYFIQALPPLALLGAWLLASASRQGRGPRLLALATVLLMAALLVQRGYLPRVAAWASADLGALRGTEQEAQYLERFGGYANDRGYSARANAELAGYIRTHTTPDERIFLFGINGAGVYFLADRLTAHRFLRVNFFVGTEFPDEEFRLASVTADLAASRPRYLVFETLHSGSEMGRAVDGLRRDPAIVQLLAGYTQDAQIEDFTLYRRTD